MSLINNCHSQNPVNHGVDPMVPDAAQAPLLNPVQGDHVFGDIGGMVRTGLQEIFGGGQLWQQRFQSFSQGAFNEWHTFNHLDLGHVGGGNEPLVRRQGPPEQDQHAHVFGEYSRRFQWYLCKIVCIERNEEPRRIGSEKSGAPNWRKNVMSRFDNVLQHLVDETALIAYLAHPNDIRHANNAIHPAISLDNAQAQANHGPGRQRIINICRNFNVARNNLEAMLMRFDVPTRTWDGNQWL